MNREIQSFINILDEVLGPYGFTPLIAMALRFVLRNPYEGVAIVDEEGRIEYLDRGSEKFYGLPLGGAKRVEVKDLIDHSLLPKTIESRNPIIGRVIEFNKETRIGSAYPIIREGKLVGAMGRLVFLSLEELENVNRQVRLLKSQIKSLRQREKQQHRALYTFDQILGVSEKIKECIRLAKKSALTGTDVLILGESGTGKELFAQAIHNYINPDRPFVSINSPAIPFELAESELFGYKKGAFSGASVEGKPGKFQAAHNGSVFLDEIGALPLSIQAKLLRVLQEREIQALGDTKLKHVQFHTISAANVDLKKLVKEGKFRNDLFYRIAKIIIHIAPLRERKEDIPALVNHFLAAINQRLNTHFNGLTDETLYSFMEYDWPGNVRELINVLEQACLNEWEGNEITLGSLPKELLQSSPKISRSKMMNYQVMKQDMEKELIIQALKEAKGNKRKAASKIGMSRTTLYNKIREYNIEF